MKKHLLWIFVIIIFSCKTDKYKKKLTGEWYFIENPTIRLRFSKDSLFLNGYPLKTKQVWRVDKRNIYLSGVSEINAKQLDGLKLQNQFHYLLSKNLDTLYWYPDKKKASVSYKLIRIKNRYDYFQKSIGLAIDLPRSEARLLPVPDDTERLNYFIGFKNHALKIKNDVRFVNLKDILRNYFEYKYKFHKDVVVNLFVDKKLSDKQMDSINNFLKNNGVNKIMRVYKSDVYSYKNHLNWHGLYQ